MILDTNALIWAITLDRRLGRTATSLIANTPDIRISIVSLYEIAIKERMGRFQYLERALSALTDLRIKIVPMSTEQLRKYASLTDVAHKDPFDVAIMALALSSRQALLTSDSAIHKLSLPGLDLIDARK